MKQTVALFVLMFTSSTVLASNCQAPMDGYIASKNLRYESSYSTIMGEAVGIPEDNQSQILHGLDSKPSVLLIHGFAASPFEVRALGKSLNSLGYTVYMPLLYGFGLNATIANQAKWQDWERDSQQDLEALTSCSEKIVMIGFSTGGTIVQRLTDANRNNAKIISSVLISPYFATATAAADNLNSFLSKKFNAVDVRFLFQATLHNPDLKAAIQNPEAYLQYFPLQAAKQVMAIGASTVSNGVGKNILKLPTLLVLSEEDGTINTNTAESYVRSRYSDYLILSLDEAFKIPHQVLVPSLNKHYKLMEKTIISFIEEQ